MASETMEAKSADLSPDLRSRQKLGRIEAIRFLATGTEVDMRLPDGGRLVAVIGPGGAGEGLQQAQSGQNVWVSGQIDDGRMSVEMFEVFAEEN